jgi:hypothetical protein
MVELAGWKGEGEIAASASVETYASSVDSGVRFGFDGTHPASRLNEKDNKQISGSCFMAPSHLAGGDSIHRKQ